MTVATILLAAAVGQVQFNRDIRPILSENCSKCHGPDEKARKAGVRLDTKEGIFASLKKGVVVVPGRPEQSALVARITHADVNERMPPADSGKKLTTAQVDLLTRWVKEGAAWEGHWAYLTPKRPALPTVKDAAWVRTPIDRFILARLEKEGLKPSPEADRTTLVRRLNFDLLGLPPENADDVPDEKLVDRLLSSPHHGERLALHWLDLVRFADSRGYHSDNPRNVAPYRDYVIRAFTENMRFDQFTVEQLAGDLLPEPTISQRVATCYNKLNLTTEEGGAQPKEYEIRSFADRVRSVSSVWMGATMGCCECHDHKFDPFTTADFYAFSAFFSDIAEAPIGDGDKGIAVPEGTQAEDLAKRDAEIAGLQAELDKGTPDVEAAQAEWEKGVGATKAPVLGPWHAVGPWKASTPKQAFDKAFPPEVKVDVTQEYKKEALKWVAHPEWADGAAHELTGENSATYLTRTIESAEAGSVDLSLGSDDGIKVWINGKELLAKEAYRAVAADQELLTVPLKAGTNVLLMKIHNGGGGHGFYFRVASAGAPPDILAIAALPREQRTAEQGKKIAAHYRTLSPILAERQKKVAELKKERDAAAARLPRCLVTTAGKPREVRIRPRGNWLDNSGPVMVSAIPGFLGKLPGNPTRLDLARWLTARENPMTARVFVNRLWQLFHGTGISRRLDDLGGQGEWPVHPELLDWLAVEFMESGWDVRHMVKLMVTSATYRQTSRVTPVLQERDPYNRLYARQARWRLDAELVRDNALAVSGLLVRKIGGPSVKPYQPKGYWLHLNFPKREWENSAGEDLYRRGMYTWWQRSFAHPGMLAFDAPSREDCCAERPRSNIPQQALVLLNDATYVEAARALAEQAMREGGPDRVAWIFRRALSRAPAPEEAELLKSLYEKHKAQYAQDAESAAKLVAVGQKPPPKDLDAAELAAWISVSRAILNLHETITRN